MLQRWEVSGNVTEPLVVGLSSRQGAVTALGSSSSGGVSLQEELSWRGFSLSSLMGTLGLVALSPARVQDGEGHVGWRTGEKLEVGLISLLLERNSSSHASCMGRDEFSLPG